MPYSSFVTCESKYVSIKICIEEPSHVNTCMLQDMSHEDEEVQHGDYNMGMNVAPGPYLSDSDLSVASIELSPAQVSL